MLKQTALKHNLAKMFAPKAIAIYGVSTDTRKIGSTILTNLITSGYEGKLFPINPKYSSIFGYRCYPDAQSIPFKVDLAIMAVPAEFSEIVLKDCAKRKIKNLVIISAGYKEVGGTGVELEQKLQKLATKYEINILGPNCLGLIVTDSKMNASFAATSAAPGDIAFMSQSGAVCTAMLDMANARNLGFSHFVSLGNKAVLDENSLLEYWLPSQRVKVIGAYLEEFTDGLDFCALQDKLNTHKPVIVLHPGHTTAAQKAISSHTGSLAGSAQVIGAALKKHGITLVDTLDQLYGAMMSLAWNKIPQGKRVAIITNAGGPGIIATDALVDAGLVLAELSEATKTALQSKLPSTASVHNPVDIIGDAMSDRYQHALEVLMNAPEVDSILLILTPQRVTQIEDTAKLLVSLKNKTGRPIVPVFIGGSYVAAGLKRLYDNKIVGFDSLDLAVDALKRTTEYGLYLQTKKRQQYKLSDISKTRPVELGRIPTNLSALAEVRVQELLTKFGFTLPQAMVVRNLEEALKAAAKINYPLVIKATTEDVVHKTEFKAIYTNITNEAQLTKALTQLQEGIYRTTGRDYPPVLMQAQIQAEEELFIGVKRDGRANVYTKEGKGFGHLILFGKGGIHTEIYKDIVSDVIPMSEQEVKDLIDSTKVSAIINGVRGSSALAKKQLVETIKNIQRLVYSYPEIAEVDFNPVMITKQACYLVDAKIFVQQ